MTVPSVAVVIPCFNAARYISVAIDSAIMQRDVSVEIIVIDDGSRDESPAILKNYADAITLITGPNRGAAYARNKGVASSRAPFIKFLDADDYLLPGALEAQLYHARSLPDGAFSYGRMLRQNEDTGQIIPHSPRDEWADNADSLEHLVLDPPVTASLLYPRPLVDKIGGFDTRFALRDDFDFFVRALIAGFRPAACPAPIYVYRDHSSHGRLSRRSSMKDYMSLIDMFLGHQNKLSKSLYYDQKLPKVLARAIWTTGRNCVRNGYTEQAIELFDLAKKIGGKGIQTGHPFYKVLARIIGPIRSESIFETVKAMRHK
jgi:glycosyltransferase involved in cell wall biosynthesis